MNRIIIALVYLIPILNITSLFAQSNDEFITVFEQSNGTETATYQEGMDFYSALANRYSTIKLLKMGMTDAGKPLHLVLYSADKDFDVKKAKANDKSILLVNNGIHPGESDGIDASMMLLRDVAKGKILKNEMKDVMLAIIPFYNIGGVLNRNATTRVNQNGPKAYGFRGNARNYDLNRDFIKNDTKNSTAFAEIFHLLDPEILIDTHVSNGADYQYVMTLVYPQPDKLGGYLQKFQTETLLPYLFKDMAENKFEMTPYVNVFGRTPESGIRQFADWPRYSSGYAALFNTIAFMTETHMLKPYKQRVSATYNFIHATVTAMSRFKAALKSARSKAKKEMKEKEMFPLQWELDTSRYQVLNFKGYEGSYIDSKLTKQKRLFYDRKKPFTKPVKYYDYYAVKKSVKKPDYYIIPQGWHNVIDRLTSNNIKLQRLEKDTLLKVEAYTIQNYKNSNRPYEGHFFHTDIELNKLEQIKPFAKGDVIVPVNQAANRFIIETLEPEGIDSYFKWNFFDAILQTKEGFSSYVFEELALEVLQQDAALKESFENKKADDKDFSNSRYRQLYYIYQHSKYFEKAFNQYPVYRLNNAKP